MNQILYVEDKSRNGKRMKIADIKKVAKLFAMLCITFGIIITFDGAYSYYKNVRYEDISKNAIPTAEFEVDGQYLVMRVEHIRPIDNVIYKWNGDKDTETIIQGDERNILTEKIELPIGNNTLDIVITDIYEKTNQYRKEYTIATGKDIKKPVVELKEDTNSIKVVATDNIGLNYITYKWNDEEEKTVKPEGVENSKIETDIELILGRNKLTVKAVDTSNNVKEEYKVYDAKVKPSIEVGVD